MTRSAVREARAAEVKAEILNSERLQSHFEQNPQDLQLLQHDRRATHISKVQDHLKHVPKYMLPRGMAVDENITRKRRKKKTRTQRKEANNRARNKANDPLQNFDGDVNMDGLMDDDGNEAGAGAGAGAAAGEEGELDQDKFFDGYDDEEEIMTKDAKNQAYLDDGDEGYGRSTSGRNAWKQKHGKGKFNRKLQQEKKDHLHKW